MPRPAAALLPGKLYAIRMAWVFPDAGVGSLKLTRDLPIDRSIQLTAAPTHGRGPHKLILPFISLISHHFPLFSPASLRPEYHQDGFSAETGLAGGGPQRLPPGGDSGTRGGGAAYTSRSSGWIPTTSECGGGGPASSSE
jgi:hypothetical protein